jgi:hypothetical protein
MYTSWEVCVCVWLLEGVMGELAGDGGWPTHNRVFQTLGSSQHEADIRHQISDADLWRKRGGPAEVQKNMVKKE